MSELALQLIAENKRTRSPKLDLGNCGLTEIPEEVFELEWLEKLNFTNWKSSNNGKGNLLTGISERISNLTNLQQLDYCGEFGSLYLLDSLSPIRGLKNLNYLFLAHTTLSDISGIKDLEHLLYINLSHSKVESFALLAELEHFVALTLHHDEEVDITPVCQKGQLLYLDVSSTKLSSYKAIKHLTSLETLKIAKLSPEDFSCFRGLVNLKELGIYDLSYQGGHTTLASFSWKKREPITDRSFFNHLSNLTDLERLEFSLFYFNDMEILKGMHKLQELTITENSIEDITSIAELKSLKTFHFTAMKKINDYSNIGKLTKLIDLQITGLAFERTNLGDISWIKPLHQLEKLTLKGEIEDISPLEHLPQISLLNLEGNQIQDISVLSKLPGIQRLDLSGNPIDNIHPLAALSSLESLDIYQTNITDLEPLSGLENLRFINLENTKVQDLKPILKLIQKGTPIEYEHGYENIGEFLGADPQYIFIKDAPIEQPPLEIIQQGSDAVVRYFEQLEKEGVDYIYEAKLLIIGEGGAGKTSLCRKLFDPEAPLPGEEESTKGVVVEPLYFDLQDGRKFRLNIWDFAGQGKYQAAHSFFYTHRSLYVLVDDTRAFDKDETYRTYYDYWLQTAHLFGGDSPLLVLHNQKADRVRTGFNIGNFQAEFPFVKELFQINLGGKEVQHIIDLRRQIERWATKLPHVGDRVPKSWVLVREDMEEERRKHPYISYDRYSEICANRGIEDEAVQSDLSAYFHDLGVFMHYKNDPLLRRDVFLQNEWVMDAVYKILDDPEIAGPKRGRFNKADLTRVWSEGLYPRRRDELLALMQQFELCYPIQDTDDFIAPQMLPGDIPDYSLGEELPLQLRYKYEFMPKGLLHRLIVRLHRYIAQEQSAVWNNGVVLERKSAIAEIVESLDRRSIAVKATGQDAKELITIIYHEMEKLHALPAFRARLKVKTLIPCNCGVCRETDQPHFFDHEDLEMRKKRGKETAECLKSYDNVPVQQLLDGLFTQMPQPNGAPRTVKIFLASSSELEEDRDQFELYFLGQNRQLKDKGISLEIMRWETFLDAVSATRKQEEYNQAVRESDIVVCLFFTKVGPFTKEEFDVAYNQFKNTGKPLIYVYFKDAERSMGDIGDEVLGLLAFKKYLKEIEQYQASYKSLEDLKLQFRDQLLELLRVGKV